MTARVAWHVLQKAKETNLDLSEREMVAAIEAASRPAALLAFVEKVASTLEEGEKLNGYTQQWDRSTAVSWLMSLRAEARKLIKQTRV